MRNISVRVFIATIAAVITLSAVGIGTTVYFSNKKVKEVEASAQQVQMALQQQIDSNKKIGYVAKKEIKLGEMISENNLEYRSDIFSGVDQSVFITEDDLGKVATVGIGVGQPVFSNMVTSALTESQTEKECGFIWLNSNLTDNDFVDVRILYPNGEDYVVVAKKAVKGVSIVANNCFLWVNEEELLSLDAAVVDANLNGAKIYTTKYVKPALQEASVVNYEPNADVIRLMSEDPNIVTASARKLSYKARAEMEKRIDLFKEAYPEFLYDDTLVDGVDKTADSILNSQAESSSSTESEIIVDDTNAKEEAVTSE